MTASHLLRLASAPQNQDSDDSMSTSSRAELLNHHQKKLLELAVQDAPMSVTLNALVKATRELRGPDTRAAVFIFDQDAAKLKFAVATGLTKEYTRAIDGFPVGPGQPSCGKAAYIGDDVIVGDVAHDPAWAPYRVLAEEHGIRACWSFLLRGENGKILGTFALYHATPCEPDAEDFREIRFFARIASILVERQMS